MKYTDPMKKNKLLISSLLLIALLALAFLSCSKGVKTTATDTDSVTATVPDSLFESPDLIYSELHGRVKSCVLSSSGESPEGMSLTLTETTFDDSGRMLTQRTVMRGLDGEIPVDDIRIGYDAAGGIAEAVNEMADGPERLDVERNGYGEMTRVGVLNPNSFQTYTTYYEWEEGVCKGERYVDANGTRIVRNYHRADGLLSGRKVIYQTEEGDLIENYTFDYTAFDAAGNWTERKAEVTLTENLNDAEEGEASSVHGPFSLSETRAITYF